MPALVDRLLQRAYALSETRVLWVNLVVAALVAAAHGGALAVSQSQASPDVESIRTLAMFSLPLAGAVIVSALLVLVFRALMPRVQRLHALIVALSASVLLLWAISLLLSGITEPNFIWTVGVLSAWVCYAAVLVVRSFFPNSQQTVSSAYYVPAYALAVAAFVDVGVLARVL